MSDKRCIFIGICGVTCGGKSTLARKLNQAIPQSILISQDDYFLEVDDPRHIFIHELNHINFDVITSLDMDKMLKDVLKLVADSKSDLLAIKSCNSVNGNNSSEQVIDVEDMLCKKLEETNTTLFIIEGFCIFNFKPLNKLFHLKYYLTLPKDVCNKRRNTRTYDPPDCEHYFEKCVWPEYLNLFADVKHNVPDVKYLDGVFEPPYKDILQDIYCTL